MNDEQRQDLIRRLRQGEEISPEWARILFPPEKREYELVYHGKDRVPPSHQKAKTFILVDRTKHKK